MRLDLHKFHIHDIGYLNSSSKKRDAMILLIDQDGCLSDIERGFFSRWQESNPSEFCISPEKRTTHEIVAQYPINLHDKVKAVYHTSNFFLDLLPVDGAVEAIKEMMFLGLDFRICTSPLYRYENCLLEKYQWIERHLGFEYTKRIILTHDKTMIRGDYLIDDKPEITGLYIPEWEHILFDAPYNQGLSHKRLTWFNWKDVLGI